jgi:hypothetical protein
VSIRFVHIECTDYTTYRIVILIAEVQSVARNSSNALLSADSSLTYQGSLATPLSFGFKLQPR